MRITKLELENFRNIDWKTIYFPSLFTAVIGVNGKGKSTILQGLRIAAGTYLLGINETSKRHIHPLEVRVEEIKLEDRGSYLKECAPVGVFAEGEIHGIDGLKWCRRIPAIGSKTSSSDADVGKARNLAIEAREKILEHRQTIDLPVILYFGTDRFWGSGRVTEPYTGINIFRHGYADWLDMRSSKFQYHNWLNGYHNRLLAGKETKGTKEAFYQALQKALPMIKDVDFEAPYLVFAVEFPNQKKSDRLPSYFHSDGIQIMVEIIAELAFRCIVLNNHLGIEAVEKSKGVVMIDELDLHIHPTWQKHIVNDIQDGFPNIQFVVTTHSPFIVQSLKEGQVINLDEDADVNPQSLSLQETAEFMGVEDVYATANEEKEEMSKGYLELLEKASNTNSEKDKKVLVEELEKREEHISDPALRAFLQMNRMAKGL